jgi:peptidyl-prolyl cis-trans isomerase D
MLRALRSSAASWVAKILLGLLVLSFGVWGIEDIFRNFTQDAVAEVGDREVSIAEFQEAFNGMLTRASQQTGQVVTPAQARLLGLDRQILRELMGEATLDQAADEFGINVSNEAVVESTRKDPMFRGPGGVFDSVRFGQILRANNLTEAAFVAQQRQFLRRQQLTGALAPELPAPTPMLEAAHRYTAETRSISYVKIEPSALGEIALPAEEALRTFFDERKGAFRAPEYRKLVLVTLTPEAITDAAAVPEADVRARYDAQQERYATPERRTVDQLRFGSMEDAAAAKSALASGKTFDQLVGEQGQSLEAISLGNLTRSQIIDQAVGDAAFALAEGEVSAPIAGTFGPALVRVRAIEAAATQPFEAVREELTKEIAAERAGKAVLEHHDTIEDERAGGMTLPEIAEKHKLTLRTVDAVDAEGKDQAGQTVELPAAQELLGKVFQSDVGVENDAVRIDGNGYVWFDVTDIIPARDRTFEEARARVEDAWRSEEIAKRLRARADDLTGRLRGGQPLAELAVAEGLAVQTSEGITRSGAGDLGRVVATSVFSTPVNAFGTAQGPEENSQLVFQVTASTVPPFDPAADQSKQIATRLSVAIAGDIAAAYVAYRQSELGATVNQAALNAALGNVQPGL